MARLTKEQRAERAAAKLLSDEGAPTNSDEQQPQQKEQLDVPGQIDMYRSDPAHSGGSVFASVHEDEVDRWKDEGWLVVPDAEE